MIVERIKSRIFAPQNDTSMIDYYAPISVYSSARDHTGQTMTLAQFMNLGRDRFMDDILSYRSMKQQLKELKDTASPLNDNEAQIPILSARIDETKRRFAAATLSGLFYPTRAKANIVSHSGFICIDIDDHYKVRGSDGEMHEYTQSLEGVDRILNDLPYVLFASHSVGGVGYFALIPLAQIPLEGKSVTETHEWYFDCLQQEFSQYGIVIDRACRDTTRLRFCSYDEHPIRKRSVTPYAGIAGFQSRNDREKADQEAQRKALAQQRLARLRIDDPDSDYRHVSVCVEEIVRRRISVADSYEDWMQLGMAFANAFGEQGRGFFNDVSSVSTKFNLARNNKDYDKFLQHHSGSSGLGTIFHIFDGVGVRFSKK